MPAQKLHHPEPHPSFTSLIDERTLAARWGVSVKTLRNWRLTGHGPPCPPCTYRVRHVRQVRQEESMAFLQRVRVPIGNDPSSSRVWFVRRYRDITTDADVLYLKFPRAGGSRGELLVPPSLLGQPNDFVRRLVDKGALWPSEHERRIEILRQIANSLPDEVGTILGRGGWHGHVFQLGQKTIGAPQKRFILRPAAVALGLLGDQQWPDRYRRTVRSGRRLAQ